MLLIFCVGPRSGLNNFTIKYDLMQNYNSFYREIVFPDGSLNDFKEFSHFTHDPIAWFIGQITKHIFKANETMLMKFKLYLAKIQLNNPFAA